MVLQAIHENRTRQALTTHYFKYNLSVFLMLSHLMGTFPKEVTTTRASLIFPVAELPLCTFSPLPANSLQ